MDVKLQGTPAVPCCLTELLWVPWNAWFLLRSLLRLLPGPHNCSGNHQQHHTPQTMHSSLKRWSSNLFFFKMQKYRLYSAFFTPGFPVFFSGNRQERQHQITVQLIAPTALLNSGTKFSVVFVYSLQRWLCCLHGNHTGLCNANKDAGRGISILHLCTLGVFIAPMCDNPHSLHLDPFSWWSKREIQHLCCRTIHWTKGIWC